MKYPVPLPGREAIVILGPREERVRVKVLGEVRQKALSPTPLARSLGNKDQRPVVRLVRVQIPGEKEPWDIAVERFVEACSDYRL